MSRDLFAIMGLDGYLKIVNPAWTDTLGISEADLLSRSFAQQVHPDDQPGRGGHPGTPPCDWALHGQSVLASPAVDMAPPRFRELDADFGTDIPLHLRRAEVLTPAARGPPALV